jgi:urease accessory protein
MHDSSLMQLMWLASPALPIGGFSYSECLEAAVDTGRAATESDAVAWLVDHLHLSLARSDLPAVAQAIAAWRANDSAHIASLNAWVLQTRESSELRAQTEQMGKSLLDWLRNHTTAPADQIATLAAQQPTYPVAFALAASRTGAPCATLLAYAFGWAENMVQAAAQGRAAGPERRPAHPGGWRARYPRRGPCLACATRTARPLPPCWPSCRAQHETQYSRLFRS